MKIWPSSIARDSQGGFTLLETLIAVTIMLVAFTAILAVESTAITATSKAKRMNIVAMLAKNRMTRLEYEFEGKTFDEFKKEDSGSFEEPYQDYTWKTAVKEIEFPSMDISGGSGSGSASGSGSEAPAESGAEGGGSDMAGLLVKLVTNFLSKSIREVTVTVSWKQGAGEQSFSVSTYWVDLNHEFALSE